LTSIRGWSTTSSRSIGLILLRTYGPSRRPGVDRIFEVAFSDNVDLDAAVSKIGTVVAAYASGQDRPTFPFWPMLFNNMTIRLLGSDDFPSEAKEQAATDITAAARDGALSITVGQTFPLENIADAHDLVDAGSRHRVVVALSD
jgi:NADPH:quinone reductase